MNKDRLHALADGIFAIVITLLVIEIRLPKLHSSTTNQALWSALRELGPTFLAYVISFLALYNLWRSHNILITILAKNIDAALLSINAIFLMFVALFPFSVRLLSEYWQTQLAISTYGIHLSLVWLTIFSMRLYIQHSNSIKLAARWTRRDFRNSNIRCLFPVAASAVAIALSFVNTKASFVIFIVVVFSGFFLRGFDPLYWLLDKLDTRRAT